jgi:hypothetical protein
VRQIIYMIVAAFLLASCRQPPNEAPPPAPRPAPATPDAQPPSPPPPGGAVLTVVTAVGPGAAAATLDRVGLIRVRLDGGLGEAASLDLPPGGTGILALDAAKPSGVLSIALLSPSGQEVGGNTLAIDGLTGSIGVIGLELGLTGRRACRRCSAPEQLTQVRGLLDTVVLWSADSEAVMSAPDERLHVATRLGISSAVRRAILEGAGGHVEDETTDEPAGLVWSVVAPATAPNILAMALELAHHPEVEAMEVFAPGRSGTLYEMPIPFQGSTD